MAKKYLGKNPLNTLMGIMLDVLPSKEIGDTDVQTLWDSIGGPIIEEPDTEGPDIEVAPNGALSNWSYTLDDVNNTVTLNRYIGSETDVIVYGRYQLNGKTYDTKMGSNPSRGNTNYMFSDKKLIKTITFNEAIDTSNVTNMFWNCKALTTINGLEYFDTSNVTSMSSMFYSCAKLTSLDLSGWNTSNVTDMNTMFMQCNVLTEIKVTTGKWNIQSGCETIRMFENCGVSAVTYYTAA